MTFVAVQGRESVPTDWGTMAEESDWADKHDKTKLNKRDIKVEDVVVGSCSDDGTLRLWRPLQVVNYIIYQFEIPIFLLHTW